MADEQQASNDYKQDLGLKKILYKYENQNDQLRSQIKALNERLQSILAKPKTPPKESLDPYQEYKGIILKSQMQKLYLNINKQKQQMKINKDGIDQRHEQKCKNIQDKIIKEEKQIRQLKFKLQKYQKIDDGIKLSAMIATNKATQLPQQIGLTTIDPSLLKNQTLKNGTIRVQNYLQKLNSILQESESSRKLIKELERQRDQNDRKLVKKHVQQVDVHHNNRMIQFGPHVNSMLPEQNPIRKRKGIWGLQNTKQNYEFIKNEIENIKKEKESTLNVVKNENIVLANKVKQLQAQLDDVPYKAPEMPPLPKKVGKIQIDLSMSTRLQKQSPLMKRSVRLDVGAGEFERNNDKNYVPKKLRSVYWQSGKNKSGIQWYDANLKSPIIGVNLWIDGGLIGLEFIHQLGNSTQHLHLLGGKKIIPIQYRLGANDYVENVILYLNDNIIQGVEFISKSGRTDSFGNKNKTKKFDFGIRKPQKPVISFGQFRINNNMSQITKLGFQII